MENIILLVEKKLKSLNFDIDWHAKKLQEAKAQKADLELELASLKIKLGED
jgi:hypothetical protein